MNSVFKWAGAAALVFAGTAGASYLFEKGSQESGQREAEPTHVFTAPVPKSLVPASEFYHAPVIATIPNFSETSRMPIAIPAPADEKEARETARLEEQRRNEMALKAQLQREKELAIDAERIRKTQEHGNRALHLLNEWAGQDSVKCTISGYIKEITGVGARKNYSWDEELALAYCARSLRDIFSLHANFDKLDSRISALERNKTETRYTPAVKKKVLLCERCGAQYDTVNEYYKSACRGHQALKSTEVVVEPERRETISHYPTPRSQEIEAKTTGLSEYLRQSLKE